METTSRILRRTTLFWSTIRSVITPCVEDVFSPILADCVVQSAHLKVKRDEEISQGEVQVLKEFDSSVFRGAQVLADILQTERREP